MCSLQIRYLIFPSTVKSQMWSRLIPPKGCPPFLTLAVSHLNLPPAAATASGQSPSWVCSVVWWETSPPVPALSQLPRRPPHLPPRPLHPPPLPPVLPPLQLRAPASAPQFTTVSPTQSTRPLQHILVPTLISSRTRARAFPPQLEECSTRPQHTPTGRPAAASPSPWSPITSSPSSRERSAWCLQTRSPSRISPINPPSLLCPPSKHLPPRLVPRT